METHDSPSIRRLPVLGGAPPAEAVNDEALEAELKAFEEAERERLGIRKERQQWVDSMLTPEVKREEREKITILNAGLTAAQDFLIEGALRGRGYKVKFIGVSDNAGLQVGKEFGNRGQCNPTYFTVGSLVKYLIDLRDVHGMETRDIIKNYMFLSAGACGPCRFGMYVTEYRKALRDAGFEGFRVMLFQQQGGLSQATGDDVGIEMNPPFFIAIIKAIVSGDVLNALAYRVRPYELVPGATNAAVEASKRILYEALRTRANIFLALYRCRKEFLKVQVDKLRPRAKVSIIGEFWAMTTEGDGNYHLQKFLESEGSENDIQLTTAWLLYNIWEVARDTRERKLLKSSDGGQYGLAAMDTDAFGVTRRLATMRVAELGLRVGFQAFALPIGLYGYKLPDMDHVAEVAQSYYSNDLRGGEGHMEVGKLIVNTVNQKCHLTVSVKPFGCMPSSGVSDGVQSLITARYPGTLYCAVETSGDGATNFYSRVQMFMYKARIMAEQELQRTYTELGVTEDQVRAFLAAHPRFASPLHKAPHAVAGTAADLVHQVAPYLTRTRAQRTRDALTRGAQRVRALASRAPAVARAVTAKARDPEFRAQVAQDAGVLRDLAAGQARGRFGPLLETLFSRAVFD
ncbi:MAG: 2-hydroxyglutaryl-CoA dehydratase [Deltaproteobacteria bacterium]|nr:2-hydroxyglutaryl-CoA dehydratase [Deltaproteobacteria bacterium]